MELLLLVPLDARSKASSGVLHLGFRRGRRRASEAVVSVGSAAWSLAVEFG